MSKEKKEESQPQPQQIQIKAGDETLKGEYSNAVNIFHTKEEFVLDFMNLFPPAGTLNARVIVSPGHFKRMLLAMQENLKGYEAGFGEVSPAEGSKATIGFE
jgi:hypothetical protein